MKQDFPNMIKKDIQTKANVTVRNHSPMSQKDRVLPERLTHDKIIKNFEAFTLRERFQKMDPWLREFFYAGGAKIISHAIERENER